MSTRLTADLDMLRSIVIQMQTDSDFVDQRLQVLDQRMEALRGTWQGDASAAQSAAHAEWASGAQTMRLALDSLRAQLDTAHGNLTAAVTANAQMWGI